MRGGDAGALCAALAREGIIAGLDLGRIQASRGANLLVAVTERHTRADLDRLALALSGWAG